MEDTPKADIVDEGQQPVELPPTENPAEVVAPEGGDARSAEPTGELPEEVKERTRQEFEKLKAKNKELAEKLSRFETPQPKRQSAFDTYAPRAIQSQQQVDQPAVDIPEIRPDEDGYIDVNLLNQTNRLLADRLKRLEEEAKIARRKAEEAETKVANYEHTDKSQKVYREFPQLDPNSETFNEKFSDLVRKELLDQMVNQGREDFLEAAMRVKRDYYDPTVQVTTTPPVVEEAPPSPQPQDVKRIEQREQINAIPQRQASSPPQDHDYLVSESRRGNRNALYERLKKSGY